MQPCLCDTPTAADAADAASAAPTTVQLLHETDEGAVSVPASACAGEECTCVCGGTRQVLGARVGRSEGQRLWLEGAEAGPQGATGPGGVVR